MTTPGPDPTEPTPEPVEQEPSALTAREEFLLPVQDFGRHIRTGSPVLARLIVTGLWRALVRASGGSGAAEGAAPAPPFQKDATAGTAEPGSAEGAAAAPASTTPSRAKAAKAAGASFFDRLAIGGLIVACSFGALGTLAPFIAYVLAPYVWWVVLAVVVGWFLAAAAVAPEDPTKNDHETVEGEEPTDPVPAAQSWEERKAAIWTFVEYETTASAAGHYRLKGKGVPIDHLLEKLRERHPLPGWERKQMTDLLDLVGIPHRSQISFLLDGRKKTPPGVHIDDLAKALGRRPLMDPRLVPDISPHSDPIPDPEQPPKSGPETVAIPGPRQAPSDTPAEGSARALIDALFDNVSTPLADPPPGAPDEGPTPAT